MKKAMFIFILNSYFISTAHGFVRSGSETLIFPKTKIEKAQSEGLGIPYNEKQIKNEINVLRSKSKSSFEKQLSDKDSNTEHYQSFLNEVNEGLDKVEQAKILAKYTLYSAFKKFEPELKQTIMNGHGVSNEKEFEYYIKRDLNEKTYFNPKLRKTDNKKDFTFETSDWGRVTIASNLKTAKWQLDVASHLDSNKLDPRAKNITIDKDSGDSEFEEILPEEQEPTMAPPLAGGEKKSNVIPKFRPTGK